ncbi:uncharacterized protein A4U43_C09F6000 [Asparagus officinalis]|uniref:RNase H type-1 domain-containing protein n=1 Tax=Asparagus officinalis TaxID=4686 RepID=A0A5P1E7F8_ASPOF|nr:uncharacterized protein A4U43_C09F6000 [Asparagus officinalis]
MSCITFSPKDMHVKNPKHDRPLYFTRYIDSIRVDRIQGVENYFTDSIHYLDGEPTDVSLVEDHDSNEADTESDCEQGFVFNDIEPIVIGFDSLDVNNVEDDDSGVIFNNDDDLAYLSCVECNPDMPDISTDVISDPLPRLYATPALHMSIQSYFVKSWRRVESSQAVFIVPARNNSQKNIIFGQTEGKPGDYYQKTRKGLGYESPTLTWCFEANGGSEDNSISSSSESNFWDSDTSTGAVFKVIITNMTSALPIENQEDDHLPLFDDPLSRQFGMQWEYHFEQHEPPIDDKVIQVNMGDESNPKYIFISDSLSSKEKEDPITLVQEYIDIFAWNYICLVLILKWLCIALLSNQMLNQSNNNNGNSVHRSWRPLKSRSRNSLIQDLSMRRNILIGWPIRPCSKKEWEDSMNGQAICDLMVNHPLGGKVDLYQDMPDETYEANTVSREQVWQLYFNGVARENPSGPIVARVGVVLISPQNYILPRAISLTELYSNNMAEYNALLIGLDMAKELGVKHLEAYGDSQLIVSQLKGEYKIRNKDLILYHTATITLANSFEGFYIDYVPRLRNTYADTLASLATILALLGGATQLGYYWPSMVRDVVPMSNDVIPTRYMLTTCTSRQSIYTRQLHHGHLRHEIALTTDMTTKENHRRRLKEFEMLDEKRLQAQQHIEFYQARISRAFDKKVRHCTFEEGDMVLTVRCPMILNSKKKEKFEPK